MVSATTSVTFRGNEKPVKAIFDGDVTGLTGVVGGRTTLTPRTAVTAVWTSFDAVDGVSVEPTAPELRMVSAGNPTAGSNVGVSIVTWKPR